MSNAQQLSLDELGRQDVAAWEDGRWLAPEDQEPQKSESGRVDGGARARQFVADYPEAWALILKWTEQDKKAGIRASMHWMLGTLRRMKWISARGHSYACDNRMSSFLVDMVAAERPDLADAFERRRKDAKGEDGDAAA